MPIATQALYFKFTVSMSKQDLAPVLNAIYFYVNIFLDPSVDCKNAQENCCEL